MTKTATLALRVVLLDLDEMVKRIEIHHATLSYAQEGEAPRYAASIDDGACALYEGLEALLQVRRDLSHALTT